jgi:ABC-type multidrug transport system fused ATPase/permease subunit
MLPRFYEVTQGNIRIDEMNITDISLSCLGAISGLSNRMSIYFPEASVRISLMTKSGKPLTGLN